MSNRRKLIVEVIGDSSKLDKSLRGVETRTQKFSRRLGVKGKTAVFAGAAAGTALITKGLTDSVNAALEAEKAQIRLSGALKSAGASQKQYAQAAEGIARVSRQAALDDEDLSDSLARLTRTTGSAAKGLKGMALAANIARARGISLASATNIVEKAHIGQFRGLKAVGVEIDKNTTSTEALDRATRKFSGSAEQYGKSASAAQDKLAVAFENLQEKIGTKLLPTLQKLAVKLVELIEWSEKNWPKFSKAVTDVYRKVRPVLQNMMKIIEAVGNIVVGMVRVVHGVLTGDWEQAWDGMKQVAVDGIAGVVKAVLTLPAKILAGLGKAAFSGLTKVGRWIGEAILAGLRGMLNQIIDLINNVIRKANRVSGALSKVVPGNLPKIPELAPVGGAAKKAAQATAPAPAASSRAPRRSTSSVGLAGGGDLVIHNSFVVDGERLAANTTRHQQRTLKGTQQKRGPNRRIGP